MTMATIRMYLVVYVFIYCAMTVVVVSLRTTGWLEQLKSGQNIALGDGVSVRMEKLNNSSNPLSYFSSHLLRISVADGGLTLSKAPGNTGLQVGLFSTTPGEHGQARGEAGVVHVIVPLLIGFKIAGSILTTLVAVIIVSLKAFLASKVALLLTGGVALKKMWSNDPPVDYHFPEHPPAYEGHEYPSGPDEHSYKEYHDHDHYPSAPAHSGPTSYAGPPSSYEPTSHEAADSHISQQYTNAAIRPNRDAGNVSAVSSIQTTGIKRRVYMHKSPAASLVTVHKITRQQPTN